MGRRRARDEGRPVESGGGRTDGYYDPDAVEVHRRGDSGYDEGRQRTGRLGPTSPPPVPQALENAGWAPPIPA